MIKKQRIESIVKMLGFVMISAWLGAAVAVLPESIRYQGYLTDPDGSPVNDSANITFRLYNVKSGGAPLWSDTQLVPVENGLFNVELGNGVLFPPGLFDDPLWLGVKVGDDPEMTPRQPLTSSGFAFKADDAQTVEGMSASSLDQSKHVADGNNPHAVTAAQTGAADEMILGAHTTDTGNPHQVTAVQVGAATPTDITNHADTAAAHHSRYSSAEAIAAMGTTTNANPLNHNRYTNAESIAAVLAADGAGSTLDADQVDGLEASELIDAASDEVRSPIDHLPFTISSPGSYYVTRNLDGSDGGLNINTDYVTLDLMGFTLNGGGAVDYGIDLNGYSAIIVRNGKVRNFALAGIYQNNNSGGDIQVIDVQVLDNGRLGASISNSGILLQGANNHVERCTVGNNGGWGIYVGAGARIMDNTVGNNGGGAGIFSDAGSVIDNNAVFGHQGDWGISSSWSTIIGNSVWNSRGGGVHDAWGSTISHNTVGGSQGNGIESLAGGSMIMGNTVRNNHGGYGILGGLGAAIIANTVQGNSHWGIHGSQPGLVKDNMLSDNNASNTAGQGGLWVKTDSRVLGNTLVGNRVNNIYVSGTGNTIEENYFNNSTNGLYFGSNQNFFANNRGHGNTNNYLNGNLNTNGGGNFEY